MKKIMLTGFDPFGQDTVNPSWEAVALLPEELQGVRVVRRRMPVEYDRVASLLEETIRAEQPDAVICVGQAGGRAMLTPEFVAINWKDASVPDNAGVLFTGEKIYENGPDAYFATVPVKSMAAAMREAGVPAAVSYTAGAYVCNNIMYHLLYLLEHRFPQIKGGFIHIPFACEQVLNRPAGTPSLPLEQMAKGREAAVRAVAESVEEGGGDLQEATGQTH